MPTFKFNSEKPYYQDGRLVKKVKTQQSHQPQCHGLHHLGMDCGAFVGQARTCPYFQTQSIPTALDLSDEQDEEEQMEYRRTELTEWYDKEGRVRKRRIRQDRFVLSPWELNTGVQFPGTESLIALQKRLWLPVKEIVTC